MTLKTTKLRDAITFALAVGATAVAGTGIAFAQDATTAPTTTVPATTPDSNTDQKAAANLDRIEVTGSRIRRVDAENASPVVVIDHAAIEKSGKLTLGDLVQELPAVSGAPTNPTVNNGGGGGASTIDLRGFGSARTLILIDGRRVVNNDVNTIPASAVERIEVLTVGASSVYGSDAVAGVVNFIMRKDFQGLQATIDIGASSHGDGQRQGGSFMFGQTGEKGNVMAGVDYNKFHAISSNNRDYSKVAQYLYYGKTYVGGGSSRALRGQISLPSGSPLRTQFGCAKLTRITGAAGGSLADFRCYKGTDAFNYQALNLIETPQERTNAYFLGNYQVSDDVTAFLQVYHNKTSSGFAIAPLPFDANSDGVSISANSYYNPFGISFGPNADGSNPNEFKTRFVSLGQRASFNAFTTDQVVAGLSGFLGNTWKWDFALNYGHFSSNSQTRGYVFFPGLKQALGPSFKDPTTGAITCGTVAAPIGGCTPVNLFNVEDPATVAALKKYAASPLSSSIYVSKGFEANASGELFNLPAGAVQLAFGAAWRREYTRNEVDYIALADLNGHCQISSEACGSPLSGFFSVGELYGEVLVPLLKDVPFAKALNLTFGSRYSNYSNFGNTVNNKLALEWRPFTDLLLRGTVAEVFRAPGINDLFSGPQSNAPQYTDPCNGYTNDPAHAGACGPARGATAIPPGGIEVPSGSQGATGIISGSNYAGYDLQPEQGRSYDWGLVYDPSWLTGLSMSVDYYRLSLNQLITALDPNISLNSCYADNNSALCKYIHRNPDGTLSLLDQPTVNQGRLDTKGWDVSLKYKVPTTAFGAFNFGFDGTYITQFDNDTDTTSTEVPVQHVAGHYYTAYGNYARVRGRLFANWNYGDWSAGFRTRYVSKLSIGNSDVRQGDHPDGACNVDAGTYCDEFHIPSYVVHSADVSYKLPSTNSSITLGVDNIADKQPPIFFQNNVLNANTDVSTYDTIGRYYYARYTVKF